MTIELTWTNVLLTIAALVYLAGVIGFRSLGIKALLWPLIWGAMFFWRP